MKRLLVSALLLLSLFAPSVAGAGAQSRSDARRVVREFYGWYLGRLSKDDFEPLKRRAEALKYLTPELHRKAPRLAGEMGADIFTCAQDWEPSWAENYTVAAPSVRGATASTTVSLKIGESESIRIRVSLRRAAGAWKISGVDCAG